MVNWIDTKFVNLLNSRLPRFTKKGENLWNFRCPLCGDSQKNKFKARGFLFEKSGSIFYKCHNCHQGMSFGNFLKSIDVPLFEEYNQEKFREKYTAKPKAEPDISKFHTPKFIKYTELSSLKKVSQLPLEHPARKYVVRRLIPNYFHSRLFYAPKFKAFANTLKPGKFRPDEEGNLNDEPRLIIPLVDENDNLFGFQGRSFAPTGIRYITIIIDDTKPKVFGMNDIDTSKHIYVFEGPIDSMFVPNSIAMAGSSLDLSKLPYKSENMTVVFDNEPRNKDIVKIIEKYINLGYNVCIWPDNIVEKDVNDMVMNGLEPQEVKSIIDNNTYQGLSAMVRFNAWKKV